MAAADYRELTASYLDLKWQLDPVAATAAGVGTADARLGRYTRADVKALLAAYRAVGGAFEELEPDHLQDQVDITAVLDDIRHTTHWLEHERPYERNPEFHVTHLLGGLHTLLIRQDQPVEHRAAALAGRLREIPRFLEDARVTLHHPALVFTETAHSVARAGRLLLREVIPAFAAKLPRGPMEEIEHGLIVARSAYDDFLEFLAVDLPPKSDGDFAIGREAFDHRLHFEHALRENAPGLLRYGEALVRETEAELAALAEALAPGTPWRALADRLRADHPPTDAVVVAYAGQMERARQFVLDRGLVTVPEGPLEVVETPAFIRPLVPFAAYDPPGAFSPDRTGWFYVSTPDGSALRDHCVHELACTALHEGYPGHHLQFLVAQRQRSPIRRVVASPLMVEGWALYCEELMTSLGFLTKPEERFFQRLHLLWRAVRVVLDVQLHTGGLSVPDAVQYMTDTLGIARSSAESEVRRYCGAPGYQLCYAVGRRELLRLRDAYREREGAGFRLKKFHDELLSYGGLPVALARWGMGLQE